MRWLTAAVLLTAGSAIAADWSDTDLGPVGPTPECLARAKAVLSSLSTSPPKMTAWSVAAPRLAGGVEAQIVCLPVRTVLFLYGGTEAGRTRIERRIIAAWAR